MHQFHRARGRAGNYAMQSYTGYALFTRPRAGSCTATRSCPVPPLCTASTQAIHSAIHRCSTPISSRTRRRTQVPARGREAAPPHPCVLQVRSQYTHHAARRRFLHGDVKPDNVMLRNPPPHPPLNTAQVPARGREAGQRDAAQPPSPPTPKYCAGSCTGT